MNLHARGQSLHNRVTASTVGTGVEVIYTRGGTARTLTASPYRQSIDSVSVPTPGAKIDDRQREYLIVYADLVSAGFGEPAAGDRITETLNGTATVFEANKPPTEPLWRWADNERTRVIVHTRKKG